MGNNLEEKWNLMFKEIDIYLTNMMASRFFFREFQKIIENNPKLSRSNHFIAWIWDNYLYSNSMGIRRLMDRRKNTISFYNLLMDFKKNSRMLSRKRYASLFKNTGFEDDYNYINLCFEKLVGKGKEYIDPLEIQKDINVLILDEKYNRIEEYINKRIAHIDRSKIKKIPTIKDLDWCIDYLEKLYIKYYALFYAASYETLVPIPQYPWKNIFKIPWIQSKKI